MWKVDCSHEDTMMHRFQFIRGHGKKRSWKQTEEKKLTGTTNIQGVDKLKMAKAFMECVGDTPSGSSSSDSSAAAPKNITKEEQALMIVLADYRNPVHQEASQRSPFLMIP